jgi:hypothetical protein
VCAVAVAELPFWPTPHKKHLPVILDAGIPHAVRLRQPFPPQTGRAIFVDAQNARRGARFFPVSKHR